MNVYERHRSHDRYIVRHGVQHRGNDVIHYWTIVDREWRNGVRFHGSEADARAMVHALNTWKHAAWTPADALADMPWYPVDGEPVTY